VSERSRTAWGWILVGCGALVAAVAVGVVFLIVLFGRGRSDFVPIVDNFLSLVDRRAFDEAYRSIGDEWRMDDTLEEFQDHLLRMHDALGPHQSLTMKSVGYQKTFGAPARVTAVFTGQFEKGEATLRVVLRRYGNEWKVDGLDFERGAHEPLPSTGLVSRRRASYAGRY
jgi:hypothetical protein